MRKLRMLLAALAIASLTVPALAQDAGAPPAGAPDVSARVKRMRARVLRDKVGLDEARAEKVGKILDGFDAERQKAQKEQRAARRALVEVVRAKGEDQKAYADAVQRFRDAQKALVDLRSRQFDAVGKELTPREQATMLVTLGKLQGKAKQKARRPAARPERRR
ncbi:MAG: periplasmic heavy metal sensor [Polyangiaceae bacterium]|nr:periplasmic heavy metal sensor [Polyangiaceae bacterium]